MQNESLLKCPGHVCDDCKVRLTCRRVRAEARWRRLADSERKVLQRKIRAMSENPFAENAEFALDIALNRSIRTQ